MPIIEPAKVATSPNATRSVSWIWPCGSMSTPVKRSASPPMERTAAVISCMMRSFIKFHFFVCCGGWDRTTDLQVMSLTSYHCSTPRFLKSGAKVQQKYEATKFCGSVR